MQEIIQSIIFVAAAVLHGITGMGFPMLGTTALAFIMPLPKVVALVALPTLLMSWLVLCSNSKKKFYQEIIDYFNAYKLLAVGSVIGSVVGVELLLILPVSLLYLLMAGVTLYYSVSGLFGLYKKVEQINVVANQKNMLLFGLLAGVIGGATNVMSPLLLMFLFSETDDKNRIVKASNLCYLLAKIVQIYMLRNEYLLLESHEYTLIIVLTICSVAGLYVGIWLRNKISANFFKTLVFFVLLILSVKLGYSGVAGVLA
ncbi:sulfite exporter TauE/SafE family protein [Moraxella nasovis]|uniref:sulfite exporter TauE/SafE family protein n=1 Tax=Moraxella nasovis TaxID=2904121 RepID=UPI001F620986|nr:sulfite exporter TauE/SafE family protein [Moraxella nasovis]UNU73048.1 sulfite exporter TauE/SafE family protein [Moraxella nasovis]